MCGIVGFTGTQPAAPVLLEGLKKLEYRGYDSAGIAVMSDGVISVSKVTGRIANLCEKTRDGAEVPGAAGVGHTRWATHGAPTEENAHPHLSNDGRFAVVHNGIIENYIALREELIRDGYRFESETDTEVIVHLVEMYYSGSVRDALIKTTNRLRGSYALGVICADEPGNCSRSGRQARSSSASESVRTTSPLTSRPWSPIRGTAFTWTTESTRNCREIP